MTGTNIFRAGAVAALAFFIIGNQNENIRLNTRVAAETKSYERAPLAKESSTMPEAIAPLFAFKAGCLLGGVMGKQWLDAQKAAPLIKGGERYRFYTLDGPAGAGEGDKPSSIGAPCEDSLEVRFSVTPGKQGIAIGGEWNAMPRIPAITDTLQTVYREAAAAILKKNGIRNPRVKLTQVLRIDLEGDGVEEVLVSATNYAGGLSPDAKAGDYSTVFLRKLIAGRVETIMIAAEFYPTAKKFNAPNEYAVTAIADADGDGIMEILIYGYYYEGHFSTLYRLIGNKVEEVLACGCGA
ncbi:MAG: hypothetical protein L0229_31805 [Blastocatellia bacterium]|nr:hypothetical protein [Blastocatellia bacterium]